MIGIQFDTNEVQAKLNELADKLSPKQMARGLYLAMNQTAKQVRTSADREIRQIYNIRQSFILRYIKVKKAHSNKMFADVSLPTSPVPMGEFMGVTGGKGVRKTRPVSVKILKAGGSITLNGAFLFKSHKVPNNHLSVMHRSNATANKSYSGGSFQFRHKRIQKTGKDLPIGAMFSVSPFSAVFNKVVRKQVVDKGERDLTKNTLTILQKMADGVIKDARKPSGGRPYKKFR